MQDNKLPKTRTGEVTCFVGEGHFILNLKIAELITLQEKTGIGPSALFRRLMNGDWHVQDIIETIRIGLIGGGMSHKDAYDLVGRVVTAGNLMDCQIVAMTALQAALFGPEDDDVQGEPVAPPESETTTAS